MFFQKKGHPEESVANKGLKKMDKLVTGLILGGIVASIYGMKKHQEKNAEHDSLEIDTEKSPSKKQGILSRIFLGEK